MQRKWFWALLVLPFLGACGTTTVDMVHPVVRTSAVGAMKKVVVLPFADYTPADSPLGYWRRNILVTEALQDEMLRFGFVPAIHEDVIGYLLERNIIQDTTPRGELSVENAVLEEELGKDWSQGMKAELVRALSLNAARDQNSGKYWTTQRLIALDHQRIGDIGRAFGADYVVRGRIMVFKTGQEDSFNPLQTGILPFFFKVGTRTVFGVAQSDTYEMIDKMAIGGLIGAAVADDNWPVEDDDVTLVGHPRFGGGLVGEEDYASLNTAIWGAAAAGIAHLAHKGGRVDSATVQIRMVVQNARTGEIVWTNRAEVKVTPKSAYGERSEDVLIAQAIQQASGRLVDNFIASETGRKIVRINSDGTFYVTPAGGLKAPDRTPATGPITVEPAVMAPGAPTAYKR